MSTPALSTDLSGEVALVTGATSGLGRRFAKVLADCGARVALAGRRVERLAQVATEIRDTGGVAFPLPLDMCDAAAVKAAPAAVEAGLGAPVSILVNNAGVPDAQRAHKMSLELIDSVFDTNLRGPYILVGAYHYMGQGAALYSITKAGIARMTEVLAVEWARFHINVNAIAPGAFSSEMMDGMIERVGDVTRHFPRKRLGQPEQLDGTLLYLVSPSSECVTGTVVVVDDGQGGR